MSEPTPKQPLAVAQEQAFLSEEGDAWTTRNAKAVAAAPATDPVLRALATVRLPEQGRLLDAGGSVGRIAAGFHLLRPSWSCRVVEASASAVAIGRRQFPAVDFAAGSIARLSESGFDVVIASAVLHWIDRALLAPTIAGLDAALVDGGVLVIHDFDAPFPRANAYVHREGIFTYKQDYAACFTALGIYHVESRSSVDLGTAADPSDPYDRRWVTTVMRKDLQGRYARFR